MLLTIVLQRIAHHHGSQDVLLQSIHQVLYSIHPRGPRPAIDLGQSAVPKRPAIPFEDIHMQGEQRRQPPSHQESIDIKGSRRFGLRDLGQIHPSHAHLPVLDAQGLWETHLEGSRGIVGKLCLAGVTQQRNIQRPTRRFHADHNWIRLLLGIQLSYFGGHPFQRTLTSWRRHCNTFSTREPEFLHRVLASQAYFLVNGS